MHTLIFIVMLVTISFLLHPYIGTAVAGLIVYRCVRCIRTTQHQSTSLTTRD